MLYSRARQRALRRWSAITVEEVKLDSFTCLAKAAVPGGVRSSGRRGLDFFITSRRAWYCTRGHWTCKYGWRSSVELQLLSTCWMNHNGFRAIEPHVQVTPTASTSKHDLQSPFRCSLVCHGRPRQRPASSRSPSPAHRGERPSRQTCALFREHQAAAEDKPAAIIRLRTHPAPSRQGRLRTSLPCVVPGPVPKSASFPSPR